MITVLTVHLIGGLVCLHGSHWREVHVLGSRCLSADCSPALLQSLGFYLTGEDAPPPSSRLDGHLALIDYRHASCHISTRSHPVEVTLQCLVNADDSLTLTTKILCALLIFDFLTYFFVCTICMSLGLKAFAKSHVNVKCNRVMHVMHKVTINNSIQKVIRKYLSSCNTCFSVSERCRTLGNAVTVNAGRDTGMALVSLSWRTQRERGDRLRLKSPILQ